MRACFARIRVEAQNSISTCVGLASTQTKLLTNRVEGCERQKSTTRSNPISVGTAVVHASVCTFALSLLCTRLSILCSTCCVFSLAMIVCWPADATIHPHFSDQVAPRRALTAVTRSYNSSSLVGESRQSITK
ncbi:unnamed protein product [Ectocarpus fasciculatus]